MTKGKKKINWILSKWETFVLQSIPLTKCWQFSGSVLLQLLKLAFTGWKQPETTCKYMDKASSDPGQARSSCSLPACVIEFLIQRLSVKTKGTEKFKCNKFRQLCPPFPPLIKSDFISLQFYLSSKIFLGIEVRILAPLEVYQALIRKYQTLHNLQGVWYKGWCCY